MKASTRALMGLVIIDAALLAGTAWLVWQVRSGGFHAPDPAEAISTITSTGGGAIGLVTVLLGLAAFHHRRKGN